MTDYDRSNTGSLFDNDRKESERHPDETGSATIVCPHCGTTTEFWVSLWHKVSAAGRSWKSLAFNEKKARAASQITPTQRRHDAAKADAYAPARPQDTWDDDVPF